MARGADALGVAGGDGSLAVVATDHCAFTTTQKRFGLGDFTKIPNGTGGLEDRMPMLWTHGVAGYHGMSTMVHLARGAGVQPIAAESLRAALFTGAVLLVLVPIAIKKYRS